MSSVCRCSQAAGVLRRCDGVLAVSGVNDAVELLAIHPRLAFAALEVEDEGRCGLEDLRAACREEAADLAEGIVLQRSLVLSLGVERGECAVAGFAAEICFLELHEPGSGRVC